MHETIWQIAGISVHPGTKLRSFVCVEDTNVWIPATFLYGAKEGKTVLITSGIHAAEYTAVQTAIELSEELQPETICGKIILLHPVNLPAFQSKSSLTPQDGKDLNYVFPPNPKGTLTDKLAFSLWNHFQKHADFHMDLHGCSASWLNPHAYYVGVGERDIVNASRDAANVLDMGYIVKSVVTDGAYNYAGTKGIPGILIERGECGYWTENDVTLYKKDVRNVLRHLGVLSDDMEPCLRTPIELEDIYYQHAHSTGCWYPSVTIDQAFCKGEKLGEVRDYFGKVLQVCYAQQDGVGLYMSFHLPVEKNGFLIAYAKPVSTK